MEAGVLTARGSFAPRSARLLGAVGDDRLVELTRRGNEAAFEAIYNRHHAALLSFCRHMLGSADEAEDALQHTFISAHRDLSSGERRLKLKPWLFTIARNRCLSILRARREQATEQLEIPTAGLSESVQERADLRELLADLRELPEDQRAALVLSELDDLSHPEIAEVIGCEARKVKALVYQARTALTEHKHAREIPCREIREQLATARGGALRRGPLRKHVNGCQGCAAFRDQVRRQRAAMALLLPVVPSIGLKRSVLAAASIGGGGTAGGIGAGAGGVVTALGLSASAAKVATVAALVGSAAVVGGTVVAVEHESGSSSRPIATDPVQAADAAATEAAPLAFAPAHGTAAALALAAREASSEKASKAKDAAGGKDGSGNAAALGRAAARAKHPGAARRAAALRSGAARRNAAQRVRRGAANRNATRGNRIRRGARRKAAARPLRRVRAPAHAPRPSEAGDSSGKSSGDTSSGYSGSSSSSSSSSGPTG